MEKKKSILRNILSFLGFILLYLIIGGSSDNSIVTQELNTHLMRENEKLRNNITLLTTKLEEIEDQITTIGEYDRELYSELLGSNYDTTNFNHFRNRKAREVINQHDSIFNSLDERSIYVAEKLAVQLVKLEKTSKWFQDNKYAMYYYPTISPIKTKDFIMVTSPYGFRKDPFTKKETFHEGIDISANVGSDVYATASGTVDKILYSKYGYGNRIVIKHKYGFETLYAHMGLIKVKRGQHVRKNQLIGTVGNTGKSTGPHLHYEVMKNNEPRDPMGYFYTYLTTELLSKNN